ncbi:toxin RelE [Lactiplantibacillus herbarum]|uniref:toxin RelE n=1 Tax=Lactiplantibacillus herbarum TaxID=1670446 RepID=UPI00064E3003|nr:toxin RelE [Lactiplantibacillus herbarum]
MYDLKYTDSFKVALQTTIDYWQSELKLSEERIRNFIESIYKNLQKLREYPFLAPDVSGVYGFAVPTFRIVIGRSYAIFYRVNQKQQIVEIGALFNTSKMQVPF